MSFPKYPAYRKADHEWLREIPSDWHEVRLKNLLAKKITDGPHTTPEFVEEGVPFLSVDGIQEGELVFSGCRYISHTAHEEYSKKAKPQKDDILMGKAASTGKIARIKTDLEFSIWSPLALIRVSSDHITPAFCEYCLKSIESQHQIELLCTSNTQKNISMDDIPKIKLALPPLSDQHDIVCFLDRETKKIDALIAEQQRLIELLQEKRQAVISHAVTKGLNSDAPMKDSGVEWLGQVPAHWSVKPLKRCASRVVVGIAEAATHAYCDEGIPILRSTNIRAGKIQGEILYVDPEYASERESKKIRAGDLVTVRTGNAGVTALVPESFDGCQCFTMLITTLLPSQDGNFYTYLLNSTSVQDYFRLEGWGTAQVNISVPILQELTVAQPPFDEQKEIAEFLRMRTSKYELLTEESLSVISLLQERRSALISAAVTGQIDVRGLAEAVA